MNNEGILRALITQEVRKYMAHTGATGVSLDDRAGVARGTVSRIITSNSDSRLSIPMLLKVCDRLDIDLRFHDGLVDPWLDSEPQTPPM